MKKLEAILLFIDLSELFDSIHRRKMEEMPLVSGLPKETAIPILYKYMNARVRSPDGDTDFFKIITGVLQGDTLALVIACSIDLLLTVTYSKKQGLTEKENVRKRFI